MSGIKRDPFTGTWAFDGERSNLSTPSPQSWIQELKVSDAEVSVRERIVATDGSRLSVSVHARCDGAQYPVIGSPVADAISYTRADPHTLVGTGTKDESVSLGETVLVSPDGGTLTLTYALYRGTREVASGTAVFQRARTLEPEA